MDKNRLIFGCRTRRSSLAFLTLAALLASGGVAADSNDLMTRSTATGDWNGLRTRLFNDGIEFRGDYVNETMHNATGGSKEVTSYVDQMRFGFDLDMGKIASVKGGSFHVTFNNRDGRGSGLTTDEVKNRLPIQEAAGGDWTRLSELSYEQVLFNKRLTLKGGWWAMGNGVGNEAPLCALVNAGFCSHPLSESGNTGWANYPNARWGFQTTALVLPTVRWISGVYQANASLNTKSKAWSLDAPHSTGAVYTSELGWLPAHKPYGYPGDYKVGVIYDTSDTAERNGSGLKAGQRKEFYVMADQQVFLEPGTSDQGLTVYGIATTSSSLTSQIKYWYTAALTYKGLIPHRDDDIVAFGYIRATVNHYITDAAYAKEPAPAPDEVPFEIPNAERLYELSYGVRLTPWFTVRPDLQYVINPGAFSTKNAENVLAYGLQVRVTF